MHIKLRVLLVSVILTTTLAGCFETKQEVTINPDGSGKTVIELKQPLENTINIKISNVNK